MPALLIATAMAWAGWEWWTPMTIPWVLAELPAAVYTAGFLLRHRPPAIARSRTPAATDQRPTSPSPGLPVAPLNAAQDDVALAAVVDLDAYRERKAA